MEGPQGRGSGGPTARRGRVPLSPILRKAYGGPRLSTPPLIASDFPIFKLPVWPLRLSGADLRPSTSSPTSSNRIDTGRGMERAFAPPPPYWLNDGKPLAPPTSFLVDYPKHQNLGVYIMSVNSAMQTNFGECILDIVR